MSDWDVDLSWVMDRVDHDETGQLAGMLFRWATSSLPFFRKDFSMKAFHALLLASLFVGTAFAADESSSPTAAPSGKTSTAQQSKMASCNKDAADKKGDERKAFMKDCLSSKPSDKPTPSAAQAAQQEKMKSCNKDAAGKTGDERKAFMKDCLSKK
jgi:hypothetical protein